LGYLPCHAFDGMLLLLLLPLLLAAAIHRDT